MSKAHLYLVRGLPGSGKSQLANAMAEGNDNMKVLSTDMFFLDRRGDFHFVPTALGEAHHWCLASTARLLKNGTDVIVANTFARQWEMDKYLNLAVEEGYGITVVSLYDAGLTNQQLAERNVHDVPVETIRNMRYKWDHAWRVPYNNEEKK